MDASDPCLRLFLSVDIVGSTAYKHQSAQEGSASWVRFFKDFFDDFPTLFHHNYLTAAGARGGDESQVIAPQVWKSLGDEILFQKALTSSVDVGIVIDSFLRTIIDYNLTFPSELSLKGSAWLAGFPVDNIYIDIGGNKDFIGPSIDLGFRISKFATPSRFVISCDLAVLLLSGKQRADFLFIGLERLKGVFSNREYPIIAVRMKNRSHRTEELVREARIPDLTSYCEDFCTNKDYPLIFPFIDGDATFGRRPENYSERLSSVRAMLRDESTVAMGEFPENQ